MSRRLGRNDSYIQNILSGGALPSMRMFLKICAFLRITPETFWSGGALDPDTLLYLHDNALLLLVGAIGCTPLLRAGCARLSRRFPAASTVLRAVAVLALLTVSTVCLANSNYQPFLYLRF